MTPPRLSARVVQNAIPMMTTRSICSRQLRDLWRLWLAVLLPAAAAMLFVTLQPWIPTEVLTRDPMAVFGGDFYVGIISNVGVLIWCATATVCFFAAGMLGRIGGDRAQRSFFLAAGALTAILLMDDLFLVHEQVFPVYLGLHERLAFGFYLLSIVGFLFVFRREILGSEWLSLLLALGFFAASVVSDVNAIHHRIAAAAGGGVALLFEDGFKLLGIVTWATYFIREAAYRIHEAGAPAAAPWEARDDQPSSEAERQPAAAYAASEGPQAS